MFQGSVERREEETSPAQAGLFFCPTTKRFLPIQGSQRVSTHRVTGTNHLSEDSERHEHPVVQQEGRGRYDQTNPVRHRCRWFTVRSNGEQHRPRLLRQGCSSVRPPRGCCLSKAPRGFPRIESRERTTCCTSAPTPQSWVTYRVMGDVRAVVPVAYTGENRHLRMVHKIITPCRQVIFFP